MSNEFYLLCWTAASIGVVHTMLGPDHYVPFIAMARSGAWTLRRTMTITLICGMGHVLSSVAVGLLGIAAGMAISTIEFIQAVRGSLAGWMFLSAGLIYFIWGLRQAMRHRPHTHWHSHEDGTIHLHKHVHTTEHLHVHEAEQSPQMTSTTAASPTKRASLTPWILFTVFLFGPCEALIPFVMYPAMKGSPTQVAIVSGIFGVSTLVTMSAAVWVGYNAIGTRSFGRYERYTHAAAGLVVVLCGLAIQFGF